MKKISNKQPNCTLKGLEEQIKPQISRGTVMIKIHVEINEIETSEKNKGYSIRCIKDDAQSTSDITFASP